MPVRIAHWPAGQLTGGHIIRHICGGEPAHIWVATAGWGGVTLRPGAWHWVSQQEPVRMAH